MQLIDKPEGDVQLPGTATVVQPKYPHGDAPPIDELGTRRMLLGIWMVSRDNPFLSRAAVNRAWAHMFGRGLVEPVDDLNERNPASHPQLFDELMNYFVETGFDMRTYCARWPTLAPISEPVARRATQSRGARRSPACRSKRSRPTALRLASPGGAERHGGSRAIGANRGASIPRGKPSLPRCNLPRPRGSISTPEWRRSCNC